MASAFETFAEFIIRRRREIAEVRMDLLAKLAELDAEMAQIERAAKAAGIDSSLEEALQERPESVRIEKLRQKVATAKTIKEAVVDILNEAGQGLTALQILPLVNRRLGVEYPRTSLSPQLSRLKADGLLTREGVLWSLAKAPQTNEASPGMPGEASKPEEDGSDTSKLFD